MPPIMQSIRLPKHIHWRVAMRRQLCFQGYYPAEFFRRLAEATVGVASELQATICFSEDAEQRCLIQGSAAVDVQLLCQRCSELFTERLSVNYRVTPVSTDNHEKALPHDYEAILTASDGSIDAVALIEDELLLSLPLVAIHPEDECLSMLSPYLNSPLESFSEASAVKRHTPFGALSVLSTKKS